MFKTNAQWVSPIEVEGLLLRHAAVAEVAVVEFRDEEGEIKPCAHVVLRTGYEPSPGLANELKEHCLSCLDRPQYYKHPRQIFFETEPLPKTASGKIQRHKLRQR
jgi:acyl-coenzyme A synthetase/AMP-(fatty) acid ligase